MKSQTGPQLGQLSQPRPPPQGTVFWVPWQCGLWNITVCLLNKSYQDKGFTPCSNSLTSRQQIQCAVKAASAIFHSSSESGMKIWYRSSWYCGRIWLSKTRPHELALAQDSEHRVYLCLHKAVVATSVKKWWEDVSAWNRHQHNDARILDPSVQVFPCQQEHTTSSSWQQKQVWLMWLGQNNRFALSYQFTLRWWGTGLPSGYPDHTNHSIHLTD